MDRRLLNLLLPAVLTAALAGCAPQDNTASGSTATTTGGAPEPATSGGAPAPEVLPTKPSVGDDVAVLDTSMGKIMILFYPSKAPRHVENFMNLAKSGFYNGTRFHRCIAGFMVQGGDPNSKSLDRASEWGQGGHRGDDGKEINVRAEFNDVHHARGVVSMARSADPAFDSASSQFFIVVGDSAFLDHKYSAFGYAYSGMDVADKIVSTGDPNADGAVEPAKAVVLKSVTITKWPVK
jgi:peptidyl-prolyl cis-trans isomerase B (cyclophilin B)